MLKNYISKFCLAVGISRNFKTFLHILINSKKHSRQLRKNKVDVGNLSCETYQVKISNKAFEIMMRTYKGDISIFYEVFWRKVYEIPAKFIQKPMSIIDLGGHVGFTSIYYALQYPNAQIYTVEASKENFNLLRSNVREFENITPINKAIYPTDGEVLFDESGYSYNTKIGEQGEPVKSVSVNTLMKEYNIEKIDLIKIDIEGAEIDLLKNNTEWLDKTDSIIIELHRPYNIEELKKDLSHFNFSIIAPSEENGLKNIFASKKLPDRDV